MGRILLLAGLTIALALVRAVVGDRTTGFSAVVGLSTAGDTAAAPQVTTRSDGAPSRSGEEVFLKAPRGGR